MKQGVITLLWADDSRTGRICVLKGRFRTFVAGKWRKKCEIGVITLLWADDSRTGRIRVQNGRFRTYVAGKRREKCESRVITLLWADNSRPGRKKSAGWAVSHFFRTKMGK